MPNCLYKIFKNVLNVNKNIIIKKIMILRKVKMISTLRYKIRIMPIKTNLKISYTIYALDFRTDFTGRENERQINLPPITRDGNLQNIKRRIKI